MVSNASPFATFNAKRMTAVEVAQSFVPPRAFRAIAGGDHCYLTGPRGSGKTTLLRMLQGESLMAWSGKEAEQYRANIDYSAIFLPTDELWASQTSERNAAAAFALQLLYAFVETMQYRSSETDAFGNPVHLPVNLSHDAEVHVARRCSEVWALERPVSSLAGLLDALDVALADIDSQALTSRIQGRASEAMRLLTIGIRLFNRAVDQPRQRWALLLDEMELSPAHIHHEVVSFVRGDPSLLTLKISMSPFDRYGHAFGVEGQPIPGHDFQTVYLSDQSRRDIHALTNGLWRESLKDRGFAYVPLSRALGRSSIDDLPSTQDGRDRFVANKLRTAQSQDREFAKWLRHRRIDVENLSGLSYNERSATIRKVFPLVVFREAILTYKQGRPVRRTRKKSLEPFTGATAVETALEGNPRWIKSAFSQMLDSYDNRGTYEFIPRGAQFDSLSALAARFEALLRVVPRRGMSTSMPVSELVDRIAVYFNRQNTGSFTPDPKNCFIVDEDTAPDVLDALILGLYAGAIVHVRDRRSPAILNDFRNQRFRLAYLLGVRDGREFPLRRGKDVRLSRILNDSVPPVWKKFEESQLGFDF